MPAKPTKPAPQPVIVLEEAAMGRYGTKPTGNHDTTPPDQRKAEHLLGFGPHAHLTYKKVLTTKKTYVQENFGRYRYMDKAQQDLTMGHIQQSLMFVPVVHKSPPKADPVSPTESAAAREAFLQWIQTPEAGHIYEIAEQAKFDKEYEHRKVHDVAAASLCMCAIM